MLTFIVLNKGEIMFHFSHEPHEVQAIIEALQHKINQLQTLLKSLVDSANAQAQTPATATAPAVSTATADATAPAADPTPAPAVTPAPADTTPPAPVLVQGAPSVVPSSGSGS
jgi:hypothetical protein